MPFERRVQVDVVRGGSLIALRVEGLRVAFDVQKDAKQSSNTARVQVYNLAPETRARFQELTDSIIIRAGYSDESIDEIFHGDIVSVSHPKTGPDVITTIEANDGQRALRSSTSSFSYGEGAGLKQVIQDVAKSLGLPVKSEDYLKLLTDDKFLQGFTFHGRTRDALNKVTERAGLEWSIQGNQLQILKRGGVVPVDSSRIPLLSPDHGLIGSPERMQRITDESPEKKPPGWRIKSILLGRLEPGGQIGLQSADIPKPMAYRIETVHHQGDTHGDDFTTLTEALDPGVLLTAAGG
jgi:hypothetical protein